MLRITALFTLALALLGALVPAPLAAAVDPGARQALVDRIEKLRNCVARAEVVQHLPDGDVTTYEEFWFLDGKVKHVVERRASAAAEPDDALPVATRPATTRPAATRPASTQPRRPTPPTPPGPSRFVPEKSTHLLLENRVESSTQLPGQRVAFGMISPRTREPGTTVEYALGLRRFGRDEPASAGDFGAADLLENDDGQVKISSLTSYSSLVAQTFDPKVGYALTGLKALSLDGRVTTEILCSDFRQVDGLWIPHAMEWRGYNYHGKERVGTRTSTLRMLHFEIAPPSNESALYRIDWPAGAMVRDQLANQMFRADAQGKLVALGPPASRPANAGPGRPPSADKPSAVATLTMPSRYSPATIGVIVGGGALLVLGLALKLLRNRA
ncbi:MAG: hypothetical protein NTW19_06530 [Planctomycetota bacterium]|nr:hypothetical protein [Planctomycetota bacterium]